MKRNQKKNNNKKVDINPKKKERNTSSKKQTQFVRTYSLFSFYSHLLFWSFFHFAHFSWRFFVGLLLLCLNRLMNCRAFQFMLFFFFVYFAHNFIFIVRGIFVCTTTTMTKENGSHKNEHKTNDLVATMKTWHFHVEYNGNPMTTSVNHK